MTTPEMTLSAEAQSLLDDHLDRIAQVLQSRRMARRERLSVCDNVEHQILTMLTRCGVGQISADAMSEVLTSVDPPESFDDAGGQQSAQICRGSRSSNSNRQGALSALLSFLVGTALMTWFALDPSEQFLWLGTPILIATAMASGALSFRAFHKAPRRRFTALYRWLGLFGMLYVPLLVLFAVPQILIEPVLDAFARPGWSDPLHPNAFGTLVLLSMAMALFSAAAVSVLAGRVINLPAKFAQK